MPNQPLAHANSARAAINLIVTTLSSNTLNLLNGLTITLLAPARDQYMHSAPRETKNLRSGQTLLN
jgi:hypothetical protein